MLFTTIRHATPPPLPPSPLLLGAPRNVTQVRSTERAPPARRRAAGREQAGSHARTTAGSRILVVPLDLEGPGSRRPSSTFHPCMTYSNTFGAVGYSCLRSRLDLKSSPWITTCRIMPMTDSTLDSFPIHLCFSGSPDPSPYHVLISNLVLRIFLPHQSSCLFGTITCILILAGQLDISRHLDLHAAHSHSLPPPPNSIAMRAGCAVCF